MNNPNDLFSLMNQSAQAHQFFAALPEPVRDAVSWQASELHSFPQLQSRAQELLAEYD